MFLFYDTITHCLYIPLDKVEGKTGKSDYNKKERWVSHKMTEDYVNFVGDLMYPKKKFGTFGYNSDKLKVYHPLNLNRFHRKIINHN